MYVGAKLQIHNMHTRQEMEFKASTRSWSLQLFLHLKVF